MNTRRLLLDTHVWLWLAFGTPEKLRPATRKALERASVSSPLLVSIISVWEVALLESKKRLRLPMSVNEWVERALDRPEIRLIGLEHARRHRQLPIARRFPPRPGGSPAAGDRPSRERGARHPGQENSRLRRHRARQGTGRVIGRENRA